MTYVVPTSTPLFDGGEPAAGAAAAAAVVAGVQAVQLGAKSMAALREAAGRTAAGGAAREPYEKITLGKAPQVAHERRPEWFSPKDVAPFERHEGAFKRLSLLEGQAPKEAWAELDPEASQSDGARREFGAAARQGDAPMASRRYDTSGGLRARTAGLASAGEHIASREHYGAY